MMPLILHLAHRGALKVSVLTEQENSACKKSRDNKENGGQTPPNQLLCKHSRNPSIFVSTANVWLDYFKYQETQRGPVFHLQCRRNWHGICIEAIGC